MTAPVEPDDDGRAGERRRRAVARMQKLLVQLHSPRLVMMLIVSLTGASGFVASYVFLHLGVVVMWVRYPAAVSIAYLVFLLLLWCWLRQVELDIHEDHALEIGDSVSDPAGPLGSVDAPDGTGDGGLFDWFSDLDDLGFALVALVVLLVGVWLVLSIVWAAPALLAELMLDVALSAGLYGRLKRIEGEHWLRTVIKRTGLSFAIVAILSGLAGAAFQSLAPGARSVGEVLKQLEK